MAFDDPVCIREYVDLDPPDDPGSGDGTEGATWSINFDEIGYEQLWSSGWQNGYSSYTTSGPSIRGTTSVEWRHRQETNHGNLVLSFETHADRLGSEGLASNGRPYEYYYEFSVYLPTEMPRASDGEYTMRFGFGGLSHGEATSGSGSPDSDGTNGWYTAPMFDTQNSPYPSGDEIAYSVNMRMPGGSTIENERIPLTIVPDDSWHRFGFYFNSNTWSGSTMNGDGVHAYYYEGEEVWRDSGRNFTSMEDHLPEHIGTQWNLLRYAGDPTSDFEWWVDAFDIYTGSDIPSEVRSGPERSW